MASKKEEQEFIEKWLGVKGDTPLKVYPLNGVFISPRKKDGLIVMVLMGGPQGEGTGERAMFTLQRGHLPRLVGHLEKAMDAISPGGADPSAEESVAIWDIFPKT